MSAQHLQQRIEFAKANLLRQRRDGVDLDSMGVIYTGNHHHSIPNNLLLDPILNPADKLLWMVMRASISNPQAPGYVPSRDDLCKAMNCSSPTVSRARAMLRMGRWMTFCMTVRDDLRRFVGDVYLLHEEPLSLADTLSRDPGYVSFLEDQSAGASASKSNRLFAGQLLNQLEGLRGDPRSPTQLEMMEQRIEVSKDLPSFFGSDSASMKPLESHVKNFNVASREGSGAYPVEITDSGGRVKNFNAVEATHVKNFNVGQTQGKNLNLDKKYFSRGSCSSYINNKYISIARAREADSETGDLALDDLLTMPIPEVLKRSHLEFLAVDTVESRHKWLFDHLSSLPIVGRILLKLPEPQRKAVGYQLFGRLIADNEDPEYKSKPIRNLVAFARELVNRSEVGDFALDGLGLLVKEAVEDKQPHFWMKQDI
jgi:hypothetical protein